MDKRTYQVTIDSDDYGMVETITVTGRTDDTDEDTATNVGAVLENRVNRGRTDELRAWLWPLDRGVGDVSLCNRRGDTIATGVWERAD